jgi:tetratricopeptide (TPR) repeat protein
MRHTLPIVLWLVLGVAPTSAAGRATDSTAHLLNLAHQAYASGDHATALEHYMAVYATHTSAALLYNIGNCHYKGGDMAHAILFYERALRLEPAADDVRANLDLARRNVVDRIADLPPTAMSLAWSRFRGSGPDTWARWALWSCLATFVLLALVMAPALRGLRTLLLIAAALMAGTTLLAVAFAHARKAEITDRTMAIIMDAKVEARGEPRAGATVLFALHSGAKVRIGQELNAWCEVSLPNGTVGWIPSAALERI